MSSLIKNVRGRNIIEFDKGKFDEWCVYLTKFNQGKYAPRDDEYFGRLIQLGNIHGLQKIYNDFVIFFSLTNKIINADILNLITKIADNYGVDAEEVDVWFSVIYAGMVAEENKINAVLKKRIKRLGMHQILIEGFNAANAANFSKGKKWRELDELMKQKGF